VEDRFFVITGGPGSGKTTLVEALAAKGIAHQPETGRAVIREEMARGGSALPWANRLAFANRMLRRDLRSYHASEGLPGAVIFDRGLPDIAGYLKLSGLPVPARFAEAARRRRYHRRVFIAPPWPEIFTQDAERKQSLVESEATYRAMVEVYAALGYELVPLPLVPVAERVAFVRGMIG